MLIQVGAQLARLHGDALSVVKLAGLFGRSVTDKAVSKGPVRFAHMSNMWVEMVFGGGASCVPRNMRLYSVGSQWRSTNSGSLRPGAGRIMGTSFIPAAACTFPV